MQEQVSVEVKELRAGNNHTPVFFSVTAVVVVVAALSLFRLFNPRSR